MDTDTQSSTYRTITTMLENDEHGSLYGYTAQLLRMIVAHPERESLRQQALDVLRAEDDYHNAKAAR